MVLWCAAGWAGFSEFHVKDKPLVMAQIEILQPDGKSVQVVTDTTWKTHPSPLSPLGNWAVPGYGGESYDARLEMPGWNYVGLDVSRWDSAAVFSPHVRVSAEMIEPNRSRRPLKPVAIEAKVPGVFRIDMGRNYAGWTHINLKGKPGQKVTLQFAERPDQIETYGQRYEYILDDQRRRRVFANNSTTPSAAGSPSAAWRPLLEKTTFAASWSAPIVSGAASSNVPTSCSIAFTTRRFGRSAR